MIKKLLIANRGEIACRIMRTARDMGIATVAVYSEYDRHARHVRQADEAICIGPAGASESYLNIAKILESANVTQADAIHPGYGFLSENAAFARACESAGLLFIGPPAAAIEAMGSKTRAKQLMESAGVPVLPGFHGADTGEQSAEQFQREAQRIGYPVLLKAAAGGGGKGMRIVERDEELASAFGAAQREASKSFGDATLLLEKLLVNPRHIEVQVFCDQHDHAVYLAERDCSIQRRYQKVIEEAPAPGVDESLRQQLGETALRAATAIDYVGAGTIEFLLDRSGEFYFMEMNTRLQVEHPVTELITGLDLVRWQLLVAAGDPLPLAQDQITLHGHAMEARLCAEDPSSDFLPATGRIHFLHEPNNAYTNIRVDSGIQAGDEIGVHYDPMLAKIIAWGETRERAQCRLQQALDHYLIAGVQTNRQLLRKILAHDAFGGGSFDTHFLPQHPELLQADAPPNDYYLIAAAMVNMHLLSEENAARADASADPTSPWWQPDGWRVSSPAPVRCYLLSDSGEHIFEVESHDAHSTVTIANDHYHVRPAVNGTSLKLDVDGCTSRWTFCLQQNALHLFCNGEYYGLSLRSNEQILSPQQQSDAGDKIVAPMSATVVTVEVEAGTQVHAGQTLLTLEAMKMEHNVRAPHDAVVAEIHCRNGDLVSGGQELIKLES